MFHRRTLFVLGAGTSAEAGMPIGAKLAATIGKKMDIRFEQFNKQVGSGDEQLFNQITNRLQDHPNELQSAGWLIRDGIALSQSIDDFLDLHRDNAYVNLFGKSAIVKTILEAERTSKLFSAHENDGREIFKPEKLADTWFLKFMHMLGRGIPKGDARQIFDNVSFIIFNYDRCVEHFLYNALQRVYGIPEAEAADILADCEIIHPFGQVGPYIPGGRGGVSFGATSVDFRQVSQQIKTYTEQITATDVMTKVEAEFHRAECIVFLGFAYHAPNMRMLKPGTPLEKKDVFGTAYEMSDADVEVVAHQLADFFKGGMAGAARKKNMHFENKLTAAGLFDNYAKSLTGGD